MDSLTVKLVATDSRGRMLLTIGIPTYNRVAVVARHVDGLVAASVHDAAQVLIIDNASTDGTFERLRQICDGTTIRVLRNPVNLGWKGNVVRLFEECNTEYLLVTSDEEPVMPAHLRELVRFLSARRPLFVSPQYYWHEQPEILFRGHLKSGPIAPHELYVCCGHSIGLVYKAQESREVLADVKFHLDKKELHIYHQVLLVAGLLLRGTCLWWDRPIVHQEYVAQSTHDLWDYMPQRWEQHKAFVDFFEDLVNKADDPAKRRAARRMLQDQQEGLIYFLRLAIGRERPDLLRPFDRGARAWYGLKRPLGIIYGLLVRHPVASWRALRMRLRWEVSRVRRRRNGSCG